MAESEATARSVLNALVGVSRVPKRSRRTHICAGFGFGLNISEYRRNVLFDEHENTVGGLKAIYPEMGEKARPPLVTHASAFRKFTNTAWVALLTFRI